MIPMPLSRERVALLFASLLLVSAVADASPWNCKPGSFGTGPGKLLVEDRTPAAAFSAVDVANGACVEIIQGDKFSVRVEAEADTLRELDIIVDNGALHIRDTKQSGFRKFFSRDSSRILRVIVTAPQYKTLAVHGSGDVIADTLKAAALRLSVAGSGDIRVNNLDAQSLTSSISGSGDIQTSGKVDSVTANISGSGDVDHSGLVADTVTVAIAGSGAAKVWANRALSVSIAGSGDVVYKGSPTIKKSVAGSGSVKPMS